MSTKAIVLCVVAVFSLITGVFVVKAAMGVCDAQEWIVVQPIMGDVRIQENPGPYWKGFAKTWAYARNIEFRYNDDPKDGDEEDERIDVTFNDGGMAKIGTYIRLQTPLVQADRISFHEQFGGIHDNVKASIKSFMIDCMKSTAPLMSASENQSARKSEFRQLVLDQMKKGLYDMNLEEVVKKDTTDVTGEAITLFKTSIRLVDGKPIITTESPITKRFKMEVVQFSVTGTNYDPATLEQFSAKKELFLGAEQAKAQRSKEVQERLMIEEKGKREKAEAEAAANVIMATAVIAAEQKANVALQTKIEAETKAAQMLSVAELDKATLLMAESAIYEQAEIKARTALKLKEAMIATAEGKKQAIELSGDITELEQAMIDAEVEKARVVAEALSQIKVPSTMIINGSANEGGTSVTEHLINIKLMESAGLFDKINIDKSEVKKRVKRMPMK
ncbi:MAG: hypothetical protein J7L15_08890 [Clostridiales bacterium]|nr:hypothetical protein [Clostridiales bacterium]